MRQAKIESGIPIPEESRPSTAKLYPWHDMAVGDSFETFKLKGPWVAGLALQQARVLASSANRRYAPKKFKAGIHADKVRVWRTL